MSVSLRPLAVAVLLILGTGAADSSIAGEGKPAKKKKAPAFVSEVKPYRSDDPNQLNCLGPDYWKAIPKKKTPPREISWPEKPGEAEICLWKDDKYAAVSVTIDDNCKPDHDWWIEQGKKHGFRFTWFVVTAGVNGKNKAFNGTWDDWKKVLDAGHAVQSHTRHHFKDGDKRSEKEIRQEYGGSIQEMQAALPGNKCITTAFPYGKGQEAICAEYFIANRGVYGVPNNAERINFANTGTGYLTKPDYINVLLGKPAESIKWLNGTNSRRGWLCPLYHFVGNPKVKPKALAQIEMLAKHKEKLWVDTFVDIAKYGQERITGKLMVIDSTDAKIVLEIKDQMRDDLFDYPLTVKCRLPDSWKSVAAKQGEKTVRARFITHEKHPYALVDVVPDKGSVTVVAAK